MGRFATMPEILSLGWLPVVERREFNLSKLTFKALYEQWPSYLKLEKYTPNRTLRSSTEHKLKVPLEDGTFQDCCAKVYNTLPEYITSCTNYFSFIKLAKAYFSNRAMERL